MGSTKRVISILLFTLVSNTLMLSATEQNKGVKTVYPVASAILMDAYRYLGALEYFSFDAITTNDDIYQDVMIQEFTHMVHVDLLRPGKLQINISGDIKNRSIYLFDNTFTVIDHDLNFYGELQVPQKIDNILDYLFEEYEITAPLANLLYTDLDKRVAPKGKGYYFGITQVDGRICHHIGFKNEERELQVWIEKSETPLIRKFSIIDKSEQFDLRSTSLLRWDIKPYFKRKHFIFKAPKDASKISILPRRSN